MKEKIKTGNGCAERRLDCRYYSGCLMHAAQTSSSAMHFSCSSCEDYKPEHFTDEDRVLETIRALKLFDALCKEGETESTRV